MTIYVDAYETICAVGWNTELQEAIFSPVRTGVELQDGLATQPIYFGRVPDRCVLSKDAIIQRFPSLANCHLSRTDRLICSVLTRMDNRIQNLKHRFGVTRIGVVLGSSVAGMFETESFFLEGEHNSSFHDTHLEIYGPVRVVQKACGLNGPAYAISTACSSSAKALASAARLINAGIIDAAIAGGIDGMSRFTVAGFQALGAVSPALTQPFSANRQGINLGEGGALFILTKEARSLELAGWGETSDAYHVSSPDPEAQSVKNAIRKALTMAHLECVDYINAHGTGTALNDAMESRAIADIFGNQVPVSSTKPITGHTLGGAGALEAAIVCMTLEDKEGRLPLHFYDGHYDLSLPPIDLVDAPRNPNSVRSALSHSFAFGGNNAVLLLKKH